MTLVDVARDDLATDCYCGDCHPACKFLPLKSCCGACMVGTSWDSDGALFRQERSDADRG